MRPRFISRQTAETVTAPSAPPGAASACTKFCSKCGKTLQMDDMFCAKCGNKQ